jgi:hypothetical protein
MLFSSCKGPQYSLESKPETYISYGSGGGFSGMVETVFLFPNGQMFETNSLMGMSSSLPSIKKKKAKALFKELEESGFLSFEMNEPGNMYYFLTMMREDGTEHRVTWGYHGTAVPGDLAQIINKLKALQQNEQTYSH